MDANDVPGPVCGLSIARLLVPGTGPVASLASLSPTVGSYREVPVGPTGSPVERYRPPTGMYSSVLRTGTRYLAPVPGVSTRTYGVSRK
jgi:hypothetical protein